MQSLTFTNYLSNFISVTVEIYKQTKTVKESEGEMQKHP